MINTIIMIIDLIVIGATESNLMSWSTAIVIIIISGCFIFGSKQEEYYGINRKTLLRKRTLKRNT